MHEFTDWVTATIILRGLAWPAWRPVAADMMPLVNIILCQAHPLTRHTLAMTAAWLPFSAHARPSDILHVMAFPIMFMRDATVGISRLFLASIPPYFLSLLPCIPLINHTESRQTLAFILPTFPLFTCYVIVCYPFSSWPSLFGLSRYCRAWSTPDTAAKGVNRNLLPALGPSNSQQDSLLSRRA
jgi:hypothetical protein